MEKHHTEWTAPINPSLGNGLERNLIRREEGPQGLLAVDFGERQLALAVAAALMCRPLPCDHATRRP